ncbi:Rac GTPase-activating protein 1-like isoform X2 [Oopsacas minuta]|uniref:Rac GTPase-activating protein 1-like isoform X2 n=1 Tax=Oopsacas minuta TaxID=111878 RepID=A0AAV7JLA2_9METZ|nr:Rac GTPase-activating protein 1-like isoform X2 [Oopsacas minuta]
MTTGLVHAFDDICDAFEPLCIGAENDFLRYLSDHSMLSQVNESKEREVGKLKKVLSQEKTKSEKLEITLKHVRARLDEQFWLREQAEMKMKQMQEEVGRFYRMRDILCSDVKYSGLLLRDKRFDPFLNDKNFRDNISSTEDSTSGTESLSLSVSLTDGSLEVADSDLDMTILRSKMRYRKPSHRMSFSSKRLSDNMHRSLSKRTKSEEALVEFLEYNNIRNRPNLPPIQQPIKKLAEFSRPPAMKGRRKPSIQHLRSRVPQGNFLEQFYVSSGTESSSETNSAGFTASSSDEHPIFNANPKIFPYPVRTPKTPKKMSPKRPHTWVEGRGLDQGGIYRVNGSTREVNELLEQFRLGHLPRLDGIEDINVICSALKKFLLNLDEPLVTHDLQPSFVKVADMSEDQAQDALSDLFARLPKANQMTLSYIITHLRHVAEQSHRNHMSDASLGRVFGPTLIGCSTPNPENKDIWDDVQKRPIVVSRMLRMENLTHYYERAIHGVFRDVSPPITPGLSAPSSNYLGSVSPERRRAKLTKDHSFFPPT